MDLKMRYIAKKLSVLPNFMHEKKSPFSFSVLDT